MRIPSRSFVAVCVIALSMSPVMPLRAGPATRPAGTPSDPAAARAAQAVAKLVGQLEDADPGSREHAHFLLSNAGPEADEPLAAALKSDTIAPATRTQIESLSKLIHGRALRLQRVQEAIDWKRRKPEQFDAVAKKDPKWGAAAHDAMWAAYAFFVKGGDHAAMMESLKRAGDLGCDDPLFLHVYSLAMTRVDGEAAKELARKAAKRLWDVDYPPDLKMQIAHHYPGFADGNDAAIRAFDARMDEWFTKAVQIPGIPAQPAEDLASIMRDVYSKRLHDRAKAVDAVCDMFAKARPDAPDPFVGKGSFYTTYAWEARGNGYANTVTADGFKLFGVRLKVAEEALEKAWKLDPADERAAVKMLTVKLGLGGGREEMEKWFRRAMEANPDCFEACTAKSYYLEPKWYGSPRDMMVFGHELLAGQNWYGGLPFVLVQQHQTLAALTRDPTAYWHQDFVWQDVRAVCEGGLHYRPDEPRLRTMYARLACQCGKWDIGAKEFDALGDKVDMSQFADRSDYESNVKQAHDAVARNGKDPQAPPDGQ